MICFSGIASPCAFGIFLVERPHTTVKFPAVLSHKTDPFPAIERATMEKDDVLLSVCLKAGEIEDSGM